MGADRKESVVLTNMCMIQDGSKVLVEEKIWKDIKGIIFPGGHIEKNEPIVDSVIREMKEETGLTIENPTLCGVKDFIDYDGSRYVVFLFKTDKFSGELTSSSEGKVFWVEADEVLNLPWIWGMDCLMQIMKEGKYAEFFMSAEDDWKPILK